jgi:capsular polysaccharide biosynthesis protein
VRWSQRLRAAPCGPVVELPNPQSQETLDSTKDTKTMHWLFSPPSIDDLVRLLKAWRFWSVGALIGALLGAAIYYVAPPPYRAHATVLVDFNLEQAWPQETDRQQFYYLERETRKLEEIAWSDMVMGMVVEANQEVTLQELRNGKLTLSQPADGGWHFYADDKDPELAAALASTWSEVFAEQVHLRKQTTDGPNSFIEAKQTQVAQSPRDRSLSLSTYLFVGAVVFLAIGSFLVLFFNKPK